VWWVLLGYDTQKEAWACNPQDYGMHECPNVEHYVERASVLKAAVESARELKIPDDFVGRWQGLLKVLAGFERKVASYL